MAEKSYFCEKLDYVKQNQNQNHREPSTFESFLRKHRWYSPSLVKFYNDRSEEQFYTIMTDSINVVSWKSSKMFWKTYNPGYNILGLDIA